MESRQDFASLQDATQKSLVSAVKTVNRIAAEDLNFQRTVNPSVGEQLDDTSARFLSLSTRLLKSAADACGLSAPTLEDGDDIDLEWRSVVDVVDTVLEKADTALDEYTGLIKRKEPPTADTPDSKKQKSTAKVVRNANITKPQAHFELQPDNFPSGPWKPIITEKPHATVSLKKSLVTAPNASGSAQYKHPYETEIAAMDYPERVFKKAEPIPFQPMDKSEATFIDTYEGVLEMLEHLKKAKEIAVDLEHHDFRTYNGLVSLMQVSTREQDWIVDTLRPWRHKLQVLNQVFADPSIVKVFHGAYMDMIWLQRDLGLYVNGLFDTYFACEMLAYPGRSLAYLLSTFAGFNADKQYQLADWRMRPIPKEMMYYARSDTHYLLYIYDRVRNDLVASSDRSNPETDLIRRALEKSKEVSLYRHEHPECNNVTGEGSRGWYNYILKNGHLSLDSDQFAVFRAMWKWRDATARKEDENPNFVLSTNTIVQIARVNPPDIKALHSMLPLSSPLARQRLNELWEQVQATKAEGGPSLLHYITSHAPEPLRRNGSSSRGVNKTPTVLPKVDDGDEAGSVQRLAQSQLFGSMPISTRWEESKKSLQRPDDHVPFPWQRFVQDANAQEDEEAEAPEPEQAPAATDEQANGAGVSEEEADEEFTLKRGKKRKAAEPAPEDDDDDTSSEGESDADEADHDTSGILALDEEKPRRPRVNKKARKEEKRQQKQLQMEQQEEKEVQKQQRREAKAQRKLEKNKKKNKNSGGAGGAGADKGAEEQKYAAVPFDYSKAASVLDADRNTQASEDKRKKDKARVFDPYVKSVEDGVKGARKAPPIRGERSATFKK